MPNLSQPLTEGDALAVFAVCTIWMLAVWMDLSDKLAELSRKIKPQDETKEIPNA